VQVSVLTIDTSRPRWYPSPVPRKLRIQYPGAIYHVMNHGDQREEIARDDQDRERFPPARGEAGRKAEWHEQPAPG